MSRKLIHNEYYPDHKCIFSRPLLKAEDATLANYTCMLIYTCLTAQNVIDLVDTQNGIKIVASVLQHLSRHDTEWGYVEK